VLFPTLQFFAFFCVVFVVYWWLENHRARLSWLFAASCFFYMSWNPWLISLILLSASVDYLVALRLGKVASPRSRRLLLVMSISFNLGLLAFFKYANFFLASARSLGGWLGFRFDPPLLDIVLPLGISFYTFETISYITDVYLGRTQPVRNLLDYALYIMFFPHLIAGPIVRPRDFLPQLGRQKRFRWARMQLGVQFFLMGLFKKAALADFLGTIADPVFKEPWLYGSAAAWLGVLAYAGQIYCDFSGYSDMAVGTAHMLGFKLPCNFRMPYFAVNITEFWRRWHISLSTWLRDYLYIPLGGNRKGASGTYRNLLLTMLLGGLWHGANWTFVAWGLYHGLLLALHRAWPWKDLGGLAGAGLRPLAVAGTFLSVCIGWVFFRAQTFADAGTILMRLVQPVDGLVLSWQTIVLAWGAFLLLFTAHLVGTWVKLRPLWPRLPAPVLGAALALVLVLTLALMREDGSAFIYFQF
jgi:alginate O-acetyltransferase complex protein AlgI